MKIPEKSSWENRMNSQIDNEMFSIKLERQKHAGARLSGDKDYERVALDAMRRKMLRCLDMVTDMQRAIA